MGTLAKQLGQIDHVKDVIERVLSHFDKKKLETEIIGQLSQAAQIAFSDHLLFEKFEIWNEERDDDALIFHIKKYFEKQAKVSLEPREQDLSTKRDQIEPSIEKSVRDRQKKIFSKRVTQLAIDRDLLTNETLGEFLGVSSEQARKYKSGENRPHLATLKNLAEKFKVSVEFFIGLSSK